MRMGHRMRPHAAACCRLLPPSAAAAGPSSWPLACPASEPSSIGASSRPYGGLPVVGRAGRGGVRGEVHWRQAEPAGRRGQWQALPPRAEAAGTGLLGRRVSGAGVQVWLAGLLPGPARPSTIVGCCCGGAGVGRGLGAAGSALLVRLHPSCEQRAPALPGSSQPAAMHGPLGPAPPPASSPVAAAAAPSHAKGHLR